MKPRRTPYTEVGICRVKCAVVGCDNRAAHQWQICADGNRWRPICKAHDVAINEAVMRLVFGREASKGPMTRYREKVLG